MKKGCVIAAVLATAAGVVLVAACAGIIFLAFGLTAGAVKEADQFLGMLGEGKTQEAYQSTAVAFRAQETEETFAATVKQLGLDDFASASWSSRSVENNLATLEGTIRTGQGGTNRLTVKLIKEQGQWKVLSLNGPAVGATAEAESKSVPSADQLNRLVEQSLSSLRAALQAKDFHAFHSSISQLWQGQVTAEELLTAFQPLIDRQVDLGEITGLQPVFDEPPTINADGVLLLSGYYPGKSQRTVFHLKYTYEHPDWKLLGIEAAVVPDPSRIPNEKDLQDLVTRSLLDFNAAVLAKDFTGFYASISQTWQGQTSAEQLADTFKTFIDNGIDISPIQDVSPLFSAPAAIDKLGVLNISGDYPTQPLRVVFELNYVYEQSSWKLLGVSLNLRE